MTLHPKFKEQIEKQRANILQQKLEIPQLREVFTQSVYVPVEERTQVQSVEDRVIETAQYNIPIRIYTPYGEGPYPLFVYFHGGGFMIGNLETHDFNCRDLVNVSGYKVIAVDYRLAPEYTFPAAPNDCYEALKWVAVNAEELNGDLTKLAVGGPSAGGNLAAVITQMARDQKGPKITKQVLVYPGVDFSTDGNLYPSIQDFGTGYALEIGNDRTKPYLASPEDADNPYAAPIRAEDLRNLPEALVITAQYDPLRDEGRAYAQKLEAAGVRTVYKCFDGMIHGFMLHTHRDYINERAEGFELVGRFLKEEVLVNKEEIYSANQNSFILRGQCMKK